MIALSVAAAICIVLFQGHTESLIPLYAVGVFLPFTAALLGLVICYWHTRKMLVPLLAMLLTGGVVVTLVTTKWLLIWPIVIFVPFIVFGCMQIHRHYEDTKQALYKQVAPPVYKGQTIILPISSIQQATKKALALINLQQCTEVYALYIGSSKADVLQMREHWQQVAPTIRLLTFVSHDQYVIKPLVRAILKIQTVAHKKQYHVIVAVPQLVTQKKWHNTLHNHHAFALKQSLLAYPHISVMTISHQI